LGASLIIKISLFIGCLTAARNTVKVVAFMQKQRQLAAATKLLCIRRQPANPFRSSLRLTATDC